MSSRGRPFHPRGRGSNFYGQGHIGPYSGHGTGRGRGGRGGHRGKVQKVRQPVRKQLIKDIMNMMTSRGPMRSTHLAQAFGFTVKSEINPTLYYMRRHGLAQQLDTRPMKWGLTDRRDAFERWSSEQGINPGSEEMEVYEDEDMSETEEEMEKSDMFSRITEEQPNLGYPVQVHNESSPVFFGSVKSVVPSQQEPDHSVHHLENLLHNQFQVTSPPVSFPKEVNRFLSDSTYRPVHSPESKSAEQVPVNQPITQPISGSTNRPLPPHLLMSANPTFARSPGNPESDKSLDLSFTSACDLMASSHKQVLSLHLQHSKASAALNCSPTTTTPAVSMATADSSENDKHTTQPSNADTTPDQKNVPHPPHMVELERTGKLPEGFIQSEFNPSNSTPSGLQNQDGQTALNSLLTLGRLSPINMAIDLSSLSNESFAVLNKNPISALMEFAQSRHQHATIEVLSESGPPHRKRFVMAAMIDNRQFPSVEKSSKKEGKTEAADVAIRTLIAEGAFSAASKNSANNGPPVRISPSNVTMVAQSASVGLPVAGNVAPSLNNESFAALNKNPISALMEYAQSRQQKARIEVLSASGPPHAPSFVMAAFINDRQFPSVTKSNKKEGKTEAAEVAMRTLFAEGSFQNKNSNTDPGKQLPPGSMTHFDKIAALSHQAFNTLAAKIPENFAGRKVIAALILKKGEDDTGSVISVGSGNRCITGQQLSLEGNTVNDSHAEIITRRGFLRFLYQQLMTYVPGQSHDLFEVVPSGRLKIKEEITFHLYISTAPCGDGALFSPRDCENHPAMDTDITREHHPTFTSNVQGLLRTKMEGGEGTIPIEPDFQGQTFDGIQRGERLRTMSCTDKICRWNVVGMQGALLSHFLEPVYLSSLTLGYLYDHGHLARAVCCRLEKGDPPISERLPKGYRLNHPWLGRVTMCDPPRETQKTKAFSINWCVGDESPEVLDGTIGICYTSFEKKLFSRVRKRALFEHFRELCTKFNRDDLLQLENYNKAKQIATEFQAAKTAMMAVFKENKFGPWVGKPVEEEMFS